MKTLSRICTLSLAVGIVLFCLASLPTLDSRVILAAIAFAIVGSIFSAVVVALVRKWEP